MANASLLKKASTTARKKVASGALNNTNASVVLQLVNTGARQYPVGSYAVAYDGDTYAKPELDANAQIVRVSARTNSSVTVLRGEFGTPITALTGRPTLALLDLEGSGLLQQLTDESSVNVSANKTLTAADSGVVQRVTADGVVVTIPTAVAGLNFIVENGGQSDGQVGFSVSPQTADTIVGNGFTAAANKDAVNTKATARVGDRIVIGGSATNQYAVQSARGIFAREA